MTLGSRSDASVFLSMSVSTIIQQCFREGAKLHRHRDLIIGTIAWELRVRLGPRLGPRRVGGWRWIRFSATEL